MQTSLKIQQQFIDPQRQAECEKLNTNSTSVICRAAVGMTFQSPYPYHTHRNPIGIPMGIPIPTEPEALAQYSNSYLTRVVTRIRNQTAVMLYSSLLTVMW